MSHGEHEKAAKTEHTQEPWSVFTVYAHPEIRDANGEFVASLAAGDVITARRIVACVNACKGISIEDLEMDNAKFVQALRERQALRDQRDELLAALEEGMNLIDRNDWRTALNRSELRAIYARAIASVKGQP